MKCESSQTCRDTFLALCMTLSQHSLENILRKYSILLLHNKVNSELNPENRTMKPYSKNSQNMAIFKTKTTIFLFKRCSDIHFSPKSGQACSRHLVNTHNVIDTRVHNTNVTQFASMTNQKTVITERLLVDTNYRQTSDINRSGQQFLWTGITQHLMLHARTKGQFFALFIYGLQEAYIIIVTESESKMRLNEMDLKEN